MSFTKRSHLGWHLDTNSLTWFVVSKIKVTELCSVVQVAHRARVRSAGVVDPQCETRRRIPNLLLRHSAAQLCITSGLLFCCCLSASFWAGPSGFSVRFTATQGSNCIYKLVINSLSSGYFGFSCLNFFQFLSFIFCQAPCTE